MLDLEIENEIQKNIENLDYNFDAFNLEIPEYDMEFLIVPYDKIDNYLMECFENDIELLSYFKTNFLKNVLPLTESEIQELQDLESGTGYRVLELLIEPNLSEFFNEYIKRGDGYGAYLSPYDGSEYIFTNKNNFTFYVFRIE